MPRKFHDYLPEKDYALGLGLGLVLLIVSQALSKIPGGLALVFRWVTFIAALINYGLILYFYDRDRKIKQKEQSNGDQPKR